MPPTHPPPEAVDALVQLAEATPLGVRGCLAVLGALLLVAGARLYRLTILAPGIIAGLLLGAWLPLTMEPAVQAVVMVVLAAAGALFCHFLERLAIHATGALLVAWLTNMLWPVITGAVAPWWGPAVGALAGLMLFPTVFKLLIKWITAALGAVTIVYAAGFEQYQIIWVAGLTLLGVMIQMGTGRKKSREG